MNRTVLFLFSYMLQITKISLVICYRLLAVLMWIFCESIIITGCNSAKAPFIWTSYSGEWCLCCSKCVSWLCDTYPLATPTWLKDRQIIYVTNACNYAVCSPRCFSFLAISIAFSPQALLVYSWCTKRACQIALG